jgi:hypothetical protein
MSELIILSKGIAYQLGAAAADVLGINLPANMISTARAEVHGDDVTVSVAYVRIDAPTETLIIGDTIASGATIIAAIDAYAQAAPLKKVYILSYAGTAVGARRIALHCQTKGVEVCIVLGLAAFGLGDNGFDLSFLHPDTITSEVYRTRAREQFDGKAVSAVGWDFGSQFLAPKKYQYLCWVEAERWGLLDHPCFAVAVQPQSMDILAHERSAFSQG